MIITLMGFLDSIKRALGGGKDKAKVAAAKTEAKANEAASKAKVASAKTEAKANEAADKTNRAAEDANEDLK